MARMRGHVVIVMTVESRVNLRRTHVDSLSGQLMHICGRVRQYGACIVVASEAGRVACIDRRRAEDVVTMERTLEQRCVHLEAQERRKMLASSFGDRHTASGEPMLRYI